MTERIPMPALFPDMTTDAGADRWGGLSEKPDKDGKDHGPRRHRGSLEGDRGMTENSTTAMEKALDRMMASWNEMTTAIQDWEAAFERFKTNRADEETKP